MSIREEVRERLGRLRCVPAFRKQEVWPILEKQPDEWLEVYLRERVAWLERYVEPVVELHEGFAQSCSVIGEVDSLHTFVGWLGLPSPNCYGDSKWLDWVFQHQSDPITSLVCAADLVVSPRPKAKSDPTEDVMLAVLMADSLRILNATHLAASLLEALLDLQPAEYSDAKILRAALDGSVLQHVPVENRCDYVRALAQALRFVEERGAAQAALLLETPLGLGPAEYADAGVLRAALDRSMLQHAKMDHRCNYVRELAHGVRLHPGRGAAQATLLLETNLELQAADYADADSLHEALDRSPLEHTEANTRCSCVHTLAESLRSVDGRGAPQAALLLETNLELQAGDYVDAGSLRAALDRSPLQYVAAGTRCNYLSALAASLVSLDGRGAAQAALLLETNLELQVSDYSDADRLRAALDRSLLQHTEANTRCAYTNILAFSLLLLIGRGAAQATLLLETHLGLDPADYADSKLLRAALDRSVLQHVPAVSRCRFVSRLANLLCFVAGRGAAQAALLLDTNLQLQVSDYADAESLRAALGRSVLQDVDAGTRCDYVRELAQALGFVPGRGAAQATLLLETNLELQAAEYADADSLREALDRSVLQHVAADSRCNYVRELAQALSLLPGRGAAQAALLLETNLELQVSDYADAESLRAALGKSVLQHVAADNRCNYVSELAGSLSSLDGRGSPQAALLLEAHLGLQSADYADAKRLRAALDRSVLQHTEANARCYNVRALATSLLSLDGRGAAQATLLLETNLELQAADYADADSLRTALNRSPLRHLAPNNRCNYVRALATSLDSLDGRGSAQATLLLEAVLWDETHNRPVPLSAVLASLIDGAPQEAALRRLPLVEAAVRNQLFFVNTFLRVAPLDHPDLLATCEAVVRYVEVVRDRDVGQSWIQIKEFFEVARQLIPALTRAGLGLVERATDPQAAEALQARLLFWVEQLENRILRERIRLTGQRAAGEGARVLPAWEPNDWGLYHVWRPGEAWMGHFRRRLGATGEYRPEVLAANALGQAAASPMRIAQGEPAAEQPGPKPARPLEELIPRGTLWLRALFDGSGALFWWAWKKEEGGLRLLGRGKSARPAARQRLEQANQLFDGLVNMIWQRRRFPDLLVALIGDPAGLRREHEDNWPRCLRGLQEDLQHLSRVEGCGLAAGTAGQLLDDISGDQSPDPVLREGWLACAAILHRAGTLEEKLEALSRWHREQLEREFDLTPLVEKQSEVDWASSDVLFQVQGPLWAMPLAWLPLGQQRLFEQVASTGTVVSLGMRKDFEQQVGGEVQPAGNLLSAHWEAVEKREHRFGLPLLHAGLHAVGTSHGHRVYSMGDEPRATIEHLCAAFAAKPFDAVVIGAHGNLFAHGVQLANGVWRGQGAELGETDLLILASCAVGRLEHQKGRDVEGLYAELAAGSCRAVIAARWPISDLETADLVTAIVQEYLGTQAAQGYIRPFDRARALNRARRRLLAAGAITHHLASAFEIYGLG